MKRENTNDRINESSFHFARQLAAYVRRGPSSLTWEWQDDPNGFGTCVLTLEYSTPDLLTETRTVYGNLFDLEQQSTVLRATQWRMEDAYRSISEHGDAFVLQMPARHVVVPIQSMNDWISAFANLTIQINLTSDADRETGTRRLRIQRDFVTHAFERTWEGDRVENQTINEHWNAVWNLMTTALATQPPIDTCCESFWGDTSRVDYAHALYAPEAVKPRDK